MRRVYLLMVLILAGCDPGTQAGYTSLPSSTMVETTPQLPTYETLADCEKAGGKWVSDCGPLRDRRCVMPWPDGGKQCVDPSECESRLCLTDLDVNCPAVGQCDEPVIPRTGEQATGVCKRNDAQCGSFIEIRKGRAQEPYHRD